MPGIAGVGRSSARHGGRHRQWFLLLRCDWACRRITWNSAGFGAKGDDKVFLISTTHGAETTGLAALMATLDAFEREGMIASVGAQRRGRKPPQ